MKAKIYHITNGDALTERLKSLKIDGDIITMRECMIEGPVSECEDQFEFFKNRDTYLSERYSLEISYQDYVMSEFDKMKDAGNDSDIYFWFEDDLFCQANWWFLLNYLKSLDVKKYLIRSGDQSPYSFGHLSNEQLLNRVEEKLEIKEKVLCDLWRYYHSNDYDRFKSIQHLVKDKYPFINEAFEAHISRIPKENFMGKPKVILSEIIKNKGTDNFRDLFNAFQQEAAIYGYGDLQVKQLLEELKKE